MIQKKQLLTMAVAACVLMPINGAWAAAQKVSATLSGANEVPANTSKAKGTLTGTFDPATNVLTYKVTYSGLSGPATGAHFHGPAEAGKNAGVAVAVKTKLASPIAETATLSPDQAKALEAGKMYFNIHTKAHAAGEIRGQVSVK